MLGRLLRRQPSRRWLDTLLARLLAAPQDDELDSKPSIISPKDFLKLCKAVRECLLRDASLVELPAGFGGDTIVVGDIHGQFRDLQRILNTSEPPPRARWVFLGDYCDRSFCGLEVLSTLFALKLRYPAHVVLLRGNHECMEITLMFGFCGECQRRANFSVWEAAMQAFDALPFAALVNGSVLCVHGGLSPHLASLSQITALPRPVELEASGYGLLTDLMWADPAPALHGWAPNPRGVSVLFGLDVARDFLERAGLRALVRAHMVQAGGFDILGDHEVITVFSCSNYRDSGNPGAVLHITPSVGLEIRTFPPIPRPARRTVAAMLQRLPIPEPGELEAAHVPEVLQRRSAELVVRLDPADALAARRALQEVVSHSRHGSERSASEHSGRGSECGHAAGC